MRIYNIFTSIMPENASERPIFIEEKFSYFALIFGLLWLLYHKIWLPSLVLLVIKIIIFIGIRQGIVDNYLAYSLELIVAFTVASFAKTWYIQHLKRNNYKLESVMIAESLDEAKLRFYQSIN